MRGVGHMRVVKQEKPVSEHGPSGRLDRGWARSRPSYGHEVWTWTRGVVGDGQGGKEAVSVREVLVCGS
jgi:hypothetical protein